MYINELVIEVTRRCNLACRHCMRGDPQKVDIKKDTIDKALEGVTEIGTITFTGGEPSLAVSKIRYIYEQIKERNIYLGGFYVVTNGKVASRSLMHVLIDLYAYIDLHAMDDNMSALVISKDQYHHELLGEPKAADRLYRALSFYRPEDRKHDITMPINEGRAADEGIGERSVRLDDLVVEVDEDNNVERVEGTVYVNALGDVCPSCDLSFRSQEEDKIGSVHENTLAEILLRTLEKKEAA